MRDQFFLTRGSLETELQELSPDDELVSCRSGRKSKTTIVIRVLVLAVLWWVAAVFITLRIKSMVHKGGSFPYTFVLTSLTNFCAGTLAWILARTCARIHHPLPPMKWDECRKLLTIGIIQGIEIGCTNKALQYLSVSSRVMAGSTNVLFMMLTAKVWDLEGLGCMRLLAAALIMIGGALQGADVSEFAELSESTAYLHGATLQFTAMLAGSQRWALVQLVTQRSQAGTALAIMSKSKLHLVQWTLPCTAVACCLLSFQFERSGLTADVLLDSTLAANVLSISLGIIVLVVAELEIVRLTSAVTLLVLGTVHQIPIALAGVVFFEEHVRSLSVVGFAFCIVGGLFYIRARCNEMTASAQDTDQDEPTPFHNMGTALDEDS